MATVKPQWLVDLQKSRADETTIKTPSGKLRVYRDARREWRWQALAPNGRIVTESGESYKRLDGLRKGLQRAGNILESVSHV